MLYLATAEVIGGYPLPPDKWLELVFKQIEMVMEMKKQGKVLFHGSFAGRQAGVFVLDVVSNEELQSLLTSFPLWPFMEWDIIPMISTEEAYKSVKQSIEMISRNK